MPKNWFSIQAAAAPDLPASISIFDEIGDWGVTAKDFISQLQALDTQAIALDINSPGGDVFQALAIFNALKRCGATITVTILGVAASAASLIAMAGDKIMMPENAFMMIHNPAGMTFGTSEDMRDTADVLDKVAASLVGIYAARTGQTPEKVQELLNAETWLTAAEAVDMGFASEMTPNMKIAASFDLSRLPEGIQVKLNPQPPAPEPAPVLNLAAPFAGRITAALKIAGLEVYAAAFALDPAITDDASLEAAVNEAREIIALCDVARKPDAAAPLIEARTKLADVRARLVDARASADQQLRIDHHLPITTPSNPAPVSAPQAVNSTSIWTARRAATQRS
jgi:ATP-dependent Clp protease protease subunit